MNSRFWDIDDAFNGTCEWLLRHKIYTSWASSDQGLLWIKGKPGSGKSTLLRYILKHTKEITNTGKEALILSFFFHGRGSELQKTPLGLFRALLHNLLDQVPDTLQNLVASFERHGEKQWHIRELQAHFKSSLLEVLKTRPVCLFVDALDECGQENAVQLVEDFESMFQTPSSNNLKQFRVCFTCRHYPILNLDSAFEVCVEEENRSDISTFLQNKLSSFRRRTSSSIPGLIEKRADGVFLWAWLMVKEVLALERSGAGPKQIQDKIWLVPQKLDTLYLGLVQNMDSESLKLVQWIRFAMTPLSLDELRWAMIVDPDCSHRSLDECEAEGRYPSDVTGMRRRVQVLGRGLVEVTSDTKAVQFIHQSVKDFFIEKDLSALDWPSKCVMPFVDQSVGKAKADLTVAAAHHQLSRTCIRYLMMEEICRLGHVWLGEMCAMFPFVEYASFRWAAHTKQSDAKGVPQDDLLQHFAEPPADLMEIWARTCRKLEENPYNYSTQSTGLVHVMLRHGLTAASWALLNKADQFGMDIDEKDSEGRTPLMLAAGIGNEAIVRLLLDKGAHLEAADLGGRTPLSWATASATDMDLWLARNGQITKDSHGNLICFEPQYMKKNLVVAGRGPGSKNNGDSSAAEKGRQTVLRLLLDRGADLETICEYGRTPLSRAIENGNEAVVRLLLDYGADLEIGAGTPLIIPAIENGNDAILQLLLDRGVDLEEEDILGQTTLFKAIRYGNDTILQLLLDQGVDLEEKDVEGQTPLFKAIEYENEPILQLLLDHGADLEERNANGHTPLFKAIEYRNEAAIRLLFEHGVNFEIGVGTPLILSIENGRDAILRLLLDQGADLEEEDVEGQTPLFKAIEYENGPILQLLLDRGANLEAVDLDGRTPLSWAAEKAFKGDIVQLLLDRGANLESADGGGRTPLSWAAGYGNEVAAYFLLDRGADLEAKDTKGWTPLSWAIFKDMSKATEQLLLEWGADPGVVNIDI
ncbi:hypothetical protein FDECE_383 [Fusarium decemcellulare]|nr:hypothetical protein FDECE_383 [Fusarium decemcellulare]